MNETHPNSAFTAGQISLLGDLIIAERTGEANSLTPAVRTSIIEMVREILMGWERLAAYKQLLKDRHVDIEHRLAEDDIIDAVVDYHFDALDDASLARLILSPGTMTDLFDLIPLQGAEAWQELLAAEGALQMRMGTAPRMDDVLRGAGLGYMTEDEQTPWTEEAELVLPDGAPGFRGTRNDSDARGTETGEPAESAAGVPFEKPTQWNIRGPQGINLHLPPSLSQRCYGAASMVVKMLLRAKTYDRDMRTLTLQAGISPPPNMMGFTLTIHLPGNQHAVMIFERSSGKPIFSNESNPIPIGSLASSVTKVTLEMR
jgi:hypothetical protein